MFLSIFARLSAIVVLARLTVAVPSATVPTNTAFDGEILSQSQLKHGTEWWYAQVVSSAQPVNGMPANLVIAFQEGSGNSYVSVSGTYENGTVLHTDIPASSTTVTANGQEVEGTWGGVGSFLTAANLSEFSLQINALDAGVTGTLVIYASAPRHYACNTTTNPYVGGSLTLPPGMQLNPAEQKLYDGFSWANTISGGHATVDFTINGTRLSFSGNGYHDGNSSPVPLAEIVSSWFWFSAQVGNFTLVATSMLARNATRMLTTGYLAIEDVILQNQCSVAGSKFSDFSTMQPRGAYVDTITNTTIPTGFDIGFVLENGDVYKFALDGLGLTENEAVYYRWLGIARGGRVGGEVYEGTTLFEWENPAEIPYLPQKDFLF